MISHIRKTISRVLAGAVMLTMMATSMPVDRAYAASDASVNLSKQYQTIKGFGGMNHPIWTSDLTATQRETAFGNADNQLGFSILRIHVDENRNNWYKELATAKAAIAKGAIVFATPWNPPSDMTESFTLNGKNLKKIGRAHV